MNAPRFIVAQKGSRPDKTAGIFTLVIDLWDDYHFKTLFTLHYGLGDESKEVGAVKIASLGMVEYDAHTTIPSRFSLLEEPFFSLGQDREYYETLMNLPGGVGPIALRSLRDVARDASLLDQVKNEEVLSTSLLRSIPLQTVATQFRRIIEGHAALTPFNFSYLRPPCADTTPPLSLNFDVVPDSTPPTNLHVMIGANGVGKSRMLRDFLLTASGAKAALGSFRDELKSARLDSTQMPFVNVVNVSFSAFDWGHVATPEPSEFLTVHAVGLSGLASGDLVDQFTESLRVCAEGRKRGRWLAAIATLARADGILAEAALDELLGSGKKNGMSASAGRVFEEMSSGHKIAVLTVTRLVELVEERSLILLDEPETHLHPPLLSALTRAISDLVIDRNGVAIVATHSPVVLQEVPRSCVWTLQRSGDDLRAFRLQTETFGESVSRLTSEVFHLDVNRTGFNQVLRELLTQNAGSAELVMSELSDQLGSEGRFVLSSLEQ
ncbi:AAA family ATPase [Frigoribacterium sp. CFBP9030]|uniref:AAA family ATPase n=1 Tax=Frigoribacterium sp. CFBP9030 TaxID=3096537 RepID=UPI002A69AD50|nr:AAA family ATPase [Frigoribacterium sp. CFBP9030]MDY0893176.1 AAA family ATPase [Frigoribacterium sp. CFBP9030]